LRSSLHDGETREGVLGSFFATEDLAKALDDYNNGDTAALQQDIEAAVVGLGTDVVCNFLLGLADVPTGGLATVIGESGCTLLATGASNAVGGG